jgi:hypothetical protein
VACDEEFHSVSNARVLSTRIDTTPVEIRSNVLNQAVSSAAIAGKVKATASSAARVLSAFIGLLIRARIVEYKRPGRRRPVPQYGAPSVSPPLFSAGIGVFLDGSKA